MDLSLNDRIRSSYQALPSLSLGQAAQRGVMVLLCWEVVSAQGDVITQKAGVLHSSGPVKPCEVRLWACLLGMLLFLFATCDWHRTIVLVKSQNGREWADLKSRGLGSIKIREIGNLEGLLGRLQC